MTLHRQPCAFCNHVVVAHGVSLPYTVREHIRTQHPEVETQIKSLEAEAKKLREDWRIVKGALTRGQENVYIHGL
jgi:hypothetical protein